MFKLIKPMLLTLGSTVMFVFTLSTNVAAQTYGIGKLATPEEVAGWDIDVRPDGTGLPPGSGTVEAGTDLYEEKCASCHGVFGEGTDRWPILAGGFETLTEDRPEKTVGSYWPYLSTLWDYIHRAMPFLQPQSLEDDEVYAITAYILYLNELVDEDFVLSKENFTSVKLPNEVAFVDDPRPDVQNTLCMENCKDPESIKITFDSTDLGVTPVDHLEDGDAASAELAANEGENIYKASCGLCHDSGVASAPILGDVAEWAPRIEQGMGVLTDHAINGYQGQVGYMPPKGGNSSLTDEQVESVIRYILDNSN